jgi:hypothetical protein
MTETKDVITEAITRSRDNAIEAVISIVKSYKDLQLPAQPKEAYDLGARDTLDTLLIHLNKFAEGVKAGRSE